MIVIKFMKVMMVLLFSAEMLFSFCRYLNWKEDDYVDDDNSDDHSSDDDSSDDHSSGDDTSDNDISDNDSFDNDSSYNDSCDDDDVMHWRCYSEFVAIGAEFLF